MAANLNYLVLHSLKYERSPNGSLTIRRSLLQRLVRTAIAAFIAILVAYVLMPLWLAPYLAVLATAGAFWYLGRPYAVFDIDRRLMSFGRRRMPFEDLGQFHMIERRDEASHDASPVGLLRGAELVTWYEVYTRVDDKPLIIAEFPTKKAATDLTDALNAVISTSR
jgi:hypothetical protein